MFCGICHSCFTAKLFSFDFKNIEFGSLTNFIIYKLLTKLLTGNCTPRFLLLILFLSFFGAKAQTTDSISQPSDSLQLSNRLVPIDTLKLDSLRISSSPDITTTDSLMKSRPSTLESQVDYQATDSIRFDMQNKKVFLFKEDVVNYGSINLVGDYMEINFNTSEIYATGVPDTLGEFLGKPVFKEGEDEFKSDEIKYNFNTKKGLITNVSTEESGGFLHGKKIKKLPDNTAFIEGGRFTTCELDHPHYSFRFRKSKVIPGDKIITGPAYFEIANVPTPVLVPFGLFPNQSGRQSGIIIPTYGQSTKQGYYLMDGGYYWAVSDFMDLTFLGSIYTRGSWALGTKANYKKRYKYTGSLNLKYAINIVGSEGSPDYRKSNDFLIQWSHNQDAKSRPKSKFSANVNIRSSAFNQYELGNSVSDRLSNTFQSSVNYSTRFGQNWNLNVNLGHSQNTLNKTVTLKFPEISFSGTRFYPMRKKERRGKLKWYENISMKYSMVAKNEVSVADSLMFTSGWEKYFKNGMKHTIPISSSEKVLKYLNWTNSITINSTWYSQHINRYWIPEYYVGLDTIAAGVGQDTIGGFITANDFNFSSSFSTKLYGMYVFGKKSPVQAIRHVLTPNVSFSYRPDFSEDQWGYYKSYYNPEEEEMILYSIFDGGIYGSPGSGKQGALNFSLSNNFEMKVKDKNDTITGTKKMVLIDNLTLSTSYNMAKDSLRWSPLTISARTKLLKNLDIRYASSWDPYILDSAGTKNINKFEWDVNRRLFRIEDMSWSAGLNFTLNNKTFNKKGDKKGVEKDKTENEDTDVLDTDQNTKLAKTTDGTIPWSINVNYSLRYGMKYSYLGYMLTKDKSIVQTLGFSGNVQVTPNWKVSVRSGYDFETNELTYTQLEIYRDLHCWEMRFSWIPTGNYKSWNFGINIKSAMFKDLKVEKKKSHLDR